MNKPRTFSNNLAIFFLMSVFLVIGIFSSPAFCDEKISEIRIASEELPFCAQQDGTGLYWDIFRAVFEPSGIKVNTSIRSYSGSVELFKKKKADAVAGSYTGEIEGALYPKSYFDVDIVAALFKKDKTEWKGKDSLKGKKLAWIKGYAYDGYLDFPVEKMEFANRKGAINALNADKVDFILDPVPDLKAALEETKTDMNKMGFEIALELKLYLAFADNDKGKELMKIFDEKFPKLVKSGEIKKIYDKWLDKTKIACPF